MKRLDVILILIFGVGVFAEISGLFEAEENERPISEEQVRRPTPEVTPPVDALPPPNFVNDPVILVQPSGPPQDSIGTAFSLDSDGLWMTARHVVDDCDAVALVIGDRNAVRVDRVWEHATADLAIFSDALNRPALVLSERLPTLGEEAFGVGYPQGEPREVSGRLIGRGRSRTIGNRYEEGILIWAEERRFPEFEGALGGISGGPLLSQSGEVMGVIVSGSVRRGRFHTADLEAIFETLDLAAADDDLQGQRFELEQDLAPRNIRTLAEGMRDEGTVSLVFCDVYEGDRGEGRQKG